jgi:hypothetical protein
MKYFCLLLVACFAGALCAQNQSPAVVVRSQGTIIPAGGGVNVAESSLVNSALITYDVTDPENDNVGCTASITGTGQFINWNQADFNVASMAAPYNHSVTTLNGEFGLAGEVYNVSLTFDDGLSTPTTFNFSINVISVPGGSSSGGGGGGGGGGCVSGGSPELPWALFAGAGLLVGASSLRRKNRLMSR